MTQQDPENRMEGIMTTSFLGKRAAIALGACIAAIAAATPAQAAVTLSPKASAGGAACDPPPDPQVLPTHRCYTQYWAGDGVMGISSIVGSTQWGAAPTPYDLEGTASSSNIAGDRLTKPLASVTYTWTFSPTCAGCFAWELRQDTSVTRGSAVNYAALQLSATHSACSTCSASVRRVLVGSETPTTQSSSYNVGTTVTISLKLTNRAGGSVPAGDITLRAELQGRSAFAVDPTTHLFQGHEVLEAQLTTKSLVR
jgi:hypothetical protein